MIIFNTLLDILLACLGVAWVIKYYNITSSGNAKALNAAESANSMAASANNLANSANRIAILSNLIQLCGDDNITTDKSLCAEYVAAMDSAVATAFPSLPQFLYIQGAPPVSSTAAPSTAAPSTAALSTEIFTSTFTTASETLTFTGTFIITLTPSTLLPTAASSAASNAVSSEAPNGASSSIPTTTIGSNSGGAEPSSESSSGIGPANLGLGSLLGIITGVFLGLCLLRFLVFWLRVRKREQGDYEKAQIM
ncbi:MAG: hypothetical protein MMC23_005137 [Stictis urceolatum]|nr:hypothetical protein [Stictis urceolata]